LIPGTEEKEREREKKEGRKEEKKKETGRLGHWDFHGDLEIWGIG
jgi:hypothetical protein